MLSIEFFFHQGVDKVGEAFEKKNNPHIEQLTLREWPCVFAVSVDLNTFQTARFSSKVKCQLRQ